MQYSAKLELPIVARGHSCQTKAWNVPQASTQAALLSKEATDCSLARSQRKGLLFYDSFTSVITTENRDIANLGTSWSWHFHSMHSEGVVVVTTPFFVEHPTSSPFHERLAIEKPHAIAAIPVYGARFLVPSLGELRPPLQAPGG